MGGRLMDMGSSSMGMLGGCIHIWQSGMVGEQFAVVPETSHHTVRHINVDGHQLGKRLPRRFKPEPRGQWLGKSRGVVHVGKNLHLRGGRLNQNGAAVPIHALVSWLLLL